MTGYGSITAYIKGGFDYFVNEYLSQFHHKEALVFNDRRIRYQQMIAEINKFSNGLISLGVKKGDRIGIWMPNNPEWIYTLLGTTQIGAIAVLINSSLSKAEAEFIINDANCKFVVVEDEGLSRNYIGFLNSMNISTEIIVVNSASSQSYVKYENLTANQNSLLEKNMGIVSDDEAIYLYTSGSTGRPKGVVLSHGASIQKPFLLSEYYQYNTKTRLLLSVPLNGVLGYSNGVLAAFAGGGTVVLRPKFDAREELRLIEEEKCTDHYSLRVTLKRLMDCPEIKTRDISSLKGGTFGAPTTVDLSKEAQHYFDAPLARGGYGMSETLGPVVHITLREMNEVGETVAGKLLPGYQVKIVNPETLEETKGVGEVLITGIAMMERYHNMENENEKVFHNGWLRTGDLGELKGDLLFIRGRIKDIIRSKGNNISCLEVEQVIKNMPEVIEVAVVPKQDPIMEEIGVAFVQLKPGTKINEWNVLDFCKLHLSAYKIPHRVIFTNNLPINVHGKVRKMELKKSLESSESLEVTSLEYSTDRKFKS